MTVLILIMLMMLNMKLRNIDMSRQIFYSITYRGTVEVENEATGDEIYIKVRDDHEYQTGGCIIRASEVDWEEEH